MIIVQRKCHHTLSKPVAINVFPKYLRLESDHLDN